MSQIEFGQSCGNVFADLELENADELYIRAQLGLMVRRIIRNLGYSQKQAAELLEIKQPEVSNLMQGKYHLFSEGHLMGFLNKLGQKIIIQISPHHEGESFAPTVEVLLQQSSEQLDDEEFEVVADQLADKLAQYGEPNSPVLSDYAVSRGGIYGDNP